MKSQSKQPTKTDTAQNNSQTPAAQAAAAVKQTEAINPTQDAYSKGSEPEPQILKSIGKYQAGPSLTPANTGGFGRVGAAITPRARAQQALSTDRAFSPEEPVRLNSADIVEKLEKAGLPNRADEVPVHVLGESRFGTHGSQIVRTIAGPTGLAQGADVQQHAPLPPSTRGKNPFQIRTENARAISVLTGRASLKDSLDEGVALLDRPLHQARKEVAGLRERLAKAGTTGPQIASLSWGQSTVSAGLQISGRAITKGNRSPLVRDINADRLAKGRTAVDVTTPMGKAIFQREMIERLHRHRQLPKNKMILDKSRKALAKELDRSREAGIIVFAAAGNEGTPNLPLSLVGADQNILNGTPGLISVGASGLGKDPYNPSDDRIAEFSASGADIAAPGQQMPIAHNSFDPNIRHSDGTSFAAPYAASVAALMVKANPSITPDQIESIITNPTLSHQVPNNPRAGNGIVNPVLAVHVAKNLDLVD